MGRAETQLDDCALWVTLRRFTACTLDVSVTIAILFVFSKVNVPKAKKAFCKKCSSHKVMKVTQYKTGKASLFAQG